MAASRKKASSRKSPAPKPAVRDDDDDDDEDDDADESAAVLATFNSETHVCVPADVFASLVSAKNALDDRAAALIESDAKRSETQFMGFQTNASIQQDQLQKAYEFGNMQREEAERQRARVSKVEMEMAQMIRQSEDAKLERDRLAADLQRGQMQLQRLEMELEAKTRQRGMELEAVKEVSKPVFAVAGQGLMQLLAQYNKIGGAPGQPSGLPAGPPVEAPPKAKEPAYDLYLEDTETFKVAFAAVYDKLQPRSIACLRALVCSALPGAPSFPDHVKAGLLKWVVEDAGEDTVMTLLQASRTAYVVEEVRAPSNGVSNGAASPTPPN